MCLIAQPTHIPADTTAYRVFHTMRDFQKKKTFIMTAFNTTGPAM
jgi:hypothetical protein